MSWPQSVGTPASYRELAPLHRSWRWRQRLSSVQKLPRWGKPISPPLAAGTWLWPGLDQSDALARTVHLGRKDSYLAVPSRGWWPCCWGPMLVASAAATPASKLGQDFVAATSRFPWLPLFSESGLQPSQLFLNRPMSLQSISFCQIPPPRLLGPTLSPNSAWGCWLSPLWWDTRLASLPMPEPRVFQILCENSCLTFCSQSLSLSGPQISHQTNVSSLIILSG